LTSKLPSISTTSTTSTTNTTSTSSSSSSSSGSLHYCRSSNNIATSQKHVM
jgi:hypothetical protein